MKVTETTDPAVSELLQNFSAIQSPHLRQMVLDSAERILRAETRLRNDSQRQRRKIES